MPNTAAPLPTEIPTFAPSGRLDDVEEGASVRIEGPAGGDIMLVEFFVDGPVIIWGFKTLDTCKYKHAKDDSYWKQGDISLIDNMKDTIYHQIISLSDLGIINENIAISHSDQHRRSSDSCQLCAIDEACRVY